MDFNYEQYTISKLFSIGKVYSVPRFQREYSWGKVELKTFFDDIIEHITFDEGAQKLKAEEYFIGNLLFVGDMNSHDNKRLEIIDGQQRLTTITIALSVLTKCFEAAGQKQLGDLVFKNIMSQDENGNPYPIFENQTPNPYFQYKIQMNNQTVEPKSQEEDLIKDAYDFFCGKFKDTSLKNEFKQKGITSFSYVELLKAIRDQIYALTMICIWTRDRNNANALFETLNAKGLELASIDLIKNALFEKLNVETPTDDAVNKWKQIKTNLSGDSNIRIDVSVFYRHFWHARYKNSSEKKLYQDFLSMVKPKNETTYSAFLDDMVAYSKYYMNIIKPTEDFFSNQTHKRFIFQNLKNINNFNVTQVRVILLILVDKYINGFLSQKNFKSVLDFLEVFHFAFTALTSSRPSALDKIYSDTAIAIKPLADQNSIVEEINAMRHKLIEILPDYLTFREAFISLTYSKNSNNSSNMVTKYVVNKLENYFANRDVNHDDASIEHIINESTDEEDTLSIGNLILLEERLNNPLSGKSVFTDKVIEYKKSSYSQIKKFLESYEKFTINDIEKRALKLCDIFYEKIMGLEIPQISPS